MKHQEINLPIEEQQSAEIDMQVSAGVTVAAPVDNTLTVSGMAADAKETGDGIRENAGAIAEKLNKPENDGTEGQLLQSNGDGTTSWTSHAPVDATLSMEGGAAEAKAAGDAIREIAAGITALETDVTGKVEKPADDGTNGQILQTNGDGTTAWVDGGLMNADNYNGIIMDVEGENLLNPTIQQGKYARYDLKTFGSLSETNVIEFDVTRIVKFIYKYTIDIPDLRGLFFVDGNGTALQTSYQALATEQDITVPDGAAKCYATADYVDQIFVYQIVGIKPREILRSQATYTSRTTGGVTYTWNSDHSKVTVSGTRSGTSFAIMYNSSSALPAGMQAGKKYRFSIKSSGNIRMAYIPYVNGTEGSQVAFPSDKIVLVDETWTGISIRMIVPSSVTAVNETIDCPEIYTIPDVKSLRDDVNDLKDAAFGSATNPLAYIRRDAGFLSVFHTVGCIGDSLASGACACKESGTVHYIDLYPFSWGQCLARLTGNTYHNFSKGGLSTRSWLTSSYATECFDGNHKCDAYFIGLGQNDKNGSLPVGTAADINLSDYSLNADTYCGNMGRIIQKLQEMQPKAPIFVFIDPNPPQGDTSYNAVICDIVELFSNVWIIDLYTYARDLFTNPANIIGSQYRSGHYSALGYQEIAFVIATYTDWIIRNNLSAFSEVEFIGTNYAWTD